jgi:hypothetical protein
MIVVAEEEVPKRKIIKVLGAIEASPGPLALNSVKSARKRLEKEAEELGANAIINYKIKTQVLGLGTLASGTAVIIE